MRRMRVGTVLGLVLLLLLLESALGRLLEPFLAAGERRPRHGTFLDDPLLDANLQQVRLGSCITAGLRVGMRLRVLVFAITQERRGVSKLLLVFGLFSRLKTMAECVICDYFEKCWIMLHI